MTAGDTFDLAIAALDAVQTVCDPQYDLLWIRIRASDGWHDDRMAPPFRELMYREVIATCAITGWTADRRVKRIHDFARLAGFLR